MEGEPPRLCSCVRSSGDAISQSTVHLPPRFLLHTLGNSTWLCPLSRRRPMHVHGGEKNPRKHVAACFLGFPGRPRTPYVSEGSTLERRAAHTNPSGRTQRSTSPLHTAHASTAGYTRGAISRCALPTQGPQKAPEHVRLHHAGDSWVRSSALDHWRRSAVADVLF